jgi:hypothetical protein
MALSRKRAMSRLGLGERELGSRRFAFRRLALEEAWP